MVAKGLLVHTAGRATGATGRNSSITPHLLVQATLGVGSIKFWSCTVAWTRELLTLCNLLDRRVDTIYYSENQEGKHTTNALLANRAALTQNMTFVLLKTKNQEAHMAHRRTN